ncbi:hypothetical protein LJC27_02340 [Christensenellaceae bacterium OttesenSCG-928-M15]|nr:hypothetical protein [Christensenellaceae bacterium OttesenSCG-928-M15]
MQRFLSDLQRIAYYRERTNLPVTAVTLESDEDFFKRKMEEIGKTMMGSFPGENSSIEAGVPFVWLNAQGDMELTEEKQKYYQGAYASSPMTAKKWERLLYELNFDGVIEASLVMEELAHLHGSLSLSHGLHGWDYGDYLAAILTRSLSLRRDIDTARFMPEYGAQKANSAAQKSRAYDKLTRILKQIFEPKGTL